MSIVDPSETARASGRTHRRLGSLVGLFLSGNDCLFLSNHPTSWNIDVFCKIVSEITTVFPMSVNNREGIIRNRKHNKHILFHHETSSNMLSLLPHMYSLDHDYKLTQFDKELLVHHWRIM